MRRGKRTFGFSATTAPARLAGKSARSGESGLLARVHGATGDLTASRAIALVVLVAMIALLLWFFVDDRFYVFAAEVEGNTLVSAEEVYRQGGLHGMSIFYIEPRQVVQGIRNGIPSVSQVRVQCLLPARVLVQIREGDVRYVWRGASAAFLVDGEGRVLKVDDGTHPELLVIQDLDNRQVSPGNQVDRVALNAVARLHSLLPEVRAFEYSAAMGISLSDARGWRVYFGDDQDLADKVATLQALVAKFARENATVSEIDLRFPESISYR